MDKHKTDVMFRTDKGNGEIVAYFPYEIHHGYTASCYVHLGQHGAACHEWVLEKTVPCSDYKVLASELKDIGYNLNVIKRRSHSKFIKAVSNASN